MSGYVIANIDVKNPEAYKEYVGKVVPTVQKFGGEYLVRAGDYKVIDGEWKYPRTVVIKFPTYEKALEWYDSEEYKPCLLYTSPSPRDLSTSRMPSSA